MSNTAHFDFAYQDLKEQPFALKLFLFLVFIHICIYKITSHCLRLVLSTCLTAPDYIACEIP